MRVLVTGAAGFIGYVVAATLVEHGHEVIGLTRSGTSVLPQGVQRLEGVLCAPVALPRVLARVEGVCHLAGLTKPESPGVLRSTTGAPTSAAPWPYSPHSPTPGPGVIGSVH